MAKAEYEEVFSIDKDKLFATITRYEDYPKFVTGCSGCEVERRAPGKARATYHVNMMKEISYTLDHVEDAAAGTLVWNLVRERLHEKEQRSLGAQVSRPGQN